MLQNSIYIMISFMFRETKNNTMCFYRYIYMYINFFYKFWTYTYQIGHSGYFWEIIVKGDI